MTCAAGFDLVQVTPPAAPGSYVIPALGGTITSWRTQADPLAVGQVGLQVWRPTSGLTYQLVGASPLVTLTPSVVNSFDLVNPIAVQAGDVLGLRIEGDALCAFAPSDGGYGGFGGPNPSPGAIETFTLFPFAQLNVEATLTTVVTPPPPPPPPPSTCDKQDQVAGDATAANETDSSETTKSDSSEKAKQDSSDKTKTNSEDKSDRNDDCQN